MRGGCASFRVTCNGPPHVFLSREADDGHLSDCAPAPLSTPGHTCAGAGLSLVIRKASQPSCCPFTWYTQTLFLRVTSQALSVCSTSQWAYVGCGSPPAHHVVSARPHRWRLLCALLQVAAFSATYAHAYPQAACGRAPSPSPRRGTPGCPAPL